MKCPYCRKEVVVVVTGRAIGKARGDNAKLRIAHAENNSPYCFAVRNTRESGVQKAVAQ